MYNGGGGICDPGIENLFFYAICTSLHVSKQCAVNWLLGNFSHDYEQIGFKFITLSRIFKFSGHGLCMCIVSGFLSSKSVIFGQTFTYLLYY